MTSRWSHPIAIAAVCCVCAAAGVLGGAFVDELVVPQANAAGGLPTKIGRYRIVWVSRPGDTGPIQCYVARPWQLRVLGVWMCG